MCGNGFVFSDYEPSELFAAIQRAVSTYKSSAQWDHLVGNGMSCDFSCESSAKVYENYYESALSVARNMVAA
jgi:starch synthase